MVRSDSNPDDVQVVWADSWHTGKKFMEFRSQDSEDGRVTVTARTRRHRARTGVGESFWERTVRTPSGSLCTT